VIRFSFRLTSQECFIYFRDEDWNEFNDINKIEITTLNGHENDSFLGFN
jgi:hypothetical protein